MKERILGKLLEKISDIKLKQRLALSGSPENRITAALKKAGWYEGRNVDITHIQRYYEDFGIRLHPAAEAFFCEYHGIADAWYVDQSNMNWGSDFGFVLFPCKDVVNVLDCMYDDSGYTMESEDYAAVRAAAGESAVLVGHICRDQCMYSLWIAENGKIYCYVYNNEVRVFDDIVQAIVSLGKGLKWESVAMKRELAQYGG